MVKISRLCIALIVIPISMAQADSTQFQLDLHEYWRTGFDARSAAMSEAGVALSRGPYAPWYNPAIPAVTRTIELGFGSPPDPEYYRNDMERNRTDWALHGAIGRWSMGLAYTSQTISWDSVEWGSWNFERSTLLVSGAYDLTHPLRLDSDLWQLSLGAGWRHDTYDDSFLSGTFHDVIDNLDLGLLITRRYRQSNSVRLGWRLGAACMNVFNPSTDSGRLIASTIRTGVALELGLTHDMRRSEPVTILAGYEREDRLRQDNVDAIHRVSAEATIFQRLYVRGGWSDAVSMEVGDTTWGIGLRFASPAHTPITGTIDFARLKYVQVLSDQEMLNRWSFTLRTEF